MRQDFAIVAERTLASHSPALVRSGPADAELIAALGRSAQRLVRSLRAGLARMCGGDAPEVKIDSPREYTGDDVIQPGQCLYSLYTLAPARTRMVSVIEAETVLRLVDRAFGGPGEAPRPIPRELPLSADLMAQRIEAVLAAELMPMLPGAHAINPLRRDGDWREILPWPTEARVAMITIAVTEGTRAPWTIRVFLPIAALGELTGLGTVRTPAPAARGAADPTDEPFADMPIGLTALLVDTRIPLRTVSRLEVGQVLNLPIARTVPIVAGGHPIAGGSIGAVDDRVAIQISQLA